MPKTTSSVGSKKVIKHLGCLLESEKIHTAFIIVVVLSRIIVSAKVSMASSHENRQLTRLEPGPSSMVPGFKTGLNNRSESPVCEFNHLPSLPKNQTIVDEYSSSEDESESDCDWNDFIKSNNDLEPSILDPRDEATPDCWIERNPSLIRLTGKHPFNSEPPLTQLMNQGFITPVPIHYVRNHGSVPRAKWEDWTVEVTGLVKRPKRFTMDQLVNEFPSRKFAATLVCAGNRRKEQNMAKQTIGFNWGPSVASTSLWCGVRLLDVLKRCGILSRRKGALHVCFESAEDLPGGGDGSKYGTSLRREVALDPSRDIILAYMQNGERLLPDHGFPVRVIIPGYIGGRMVKWLRRIEVSTHESQSYYHFQDNRVLPTHVDAELANTEGWWHKPEYIINEMNINSVITTPFHEEILPINSATMEKPYVLRGYAYSGGGKKVIRVEITIDDGEKWLVCTLYQPEKCNKYGKYWCWSFWSIEVEVIHLLGSKDVVVRAWDETHNTQPEHLIWNVTGMMNNCMYRVKITVCKPGKGEVALLFEHPIKPGNDPGGWLARKMQVDTSETQHALKKMDIISSKMYSTTELKKHNWNESAWIVVHGHVYDCTSFLKDHPGGADSILINAGSDCTEEFDAIHSDKAKKMLEDYRVGELVISNPSTKEEVITSENYALIQGEKIKCKLALKISVSHDVCLFKFQLPSPNQVLGLPIGNHIVLFATIDDKLCMRGYTPTSSPDELGYFDVVVKVYFNGLMSRFLDLLPLGSTLDVKGPLGHIEYSGRGKFIVHGKHKFAKRLAMVAGGTGITPIYQVIQAIVKDREDNTEMCVVYANRNEDDILLREDLDNWVEKYNAKLKVWYVVGETKRDMSREQWKYSVGHITEDILKAHIPQGSSDTLALACGPPGMIQSVVRPNLEKMNYDVKNSLLVF